MSRRIGSVSATQPQSPAGAPVLVLVTGPPGSGKSAVAAALREQLHLPLIAKDSLKEALGDALEVQGRAESQPLGAAVFMLLARVAHELLANNVSLIAEGNFQPASALFVDLPPARIVQVHVTAEPALLRTRMLERAEHRHRRALGRRGRRRGGRPRRRRRLAGAAARRRPRRDRHHDVARPARRRRARRRAGAKRCGAPLSLGSGHRGAPARG